MAKDHSTISSYNQMTVSTTPYSLETDHDNFYLEDENEGVEVLGAELSPRNFREWSHLTAGRLVRSKFFKRTILGMILLCCILMGVSTWDKTQRNSALNVVIDKAITFFQIIFALEIIMEFIHYQEKILYRGWMIFDLVVVTSSIFITKTLLILRAFRLVRALRKASGIAELRQLVKALLYVFPKMAAIVFLLLVLFYMFSVLFTDLFGGLELSENYFGRMDRTAWTLFQIMTLDNWSSITNEVMQIYPWSFILFLVFIVTSTFFIGSLVIAIMGEAVSRTDELIWKNFDSAPTLQYSASKDAQRIETKMEELTQSVNEIARMQVSVQDALNHLLRQQQAKTD